MDLLQNGGKIKKRSRVLLIVLLLILLTILGFIANHYLRIYRGCPYSNNKIHYSFNTGCSLVEESFPFDGCSYNGTCKSFVSPGTGSFVITATPITEVISAQYANINERATHLELIDLFGDIGDVNQYSIGFTYYFSNNKLIEKIQPLGDNDSIYKEVEIAPFLTNKDNVNFYRFMNRYCAAGNSYSVCFTKNDKITAESENEMKKLLDTFKFN